jgi:indole-3-acetate monooxygenase
VTGAAIDYLARIEALAPAIAAAAAEIERGRRLPPALLAGMIEAGLFRLLVPRPLGGGEIDPPRFVEVLEAVARRDASTAWCLGQNAVCAMVAAFLPSEAAAAIFARDPVGILAWGAGASGRATVVEGGFRVTGAWSFASGGRHASWLGGHCLVHEADGSPRLLADGSPAQRTVIFPADRARWTDIWDVIGLRGTGSDAYAVTDLFVPADYSVARDDQSERRYDGTLYGFGTNAMFAAGFAGVALGIARAMLDGVIALAKDKTPRGYRSALKDSAVAQSEIAQWEARLRAARFYLLGTVAETWREVERSRAMTLEQRMAIRLAATHTIQEASGVADAAYHAAGASAIFASNPFERRFRDMHAVAQQLQGRRSHFETVGRYFLGLDADPSFL